MESAVRVLEVNDAWKKLNGIMREIIEKNIPNHKRTNKRRPWVTREVQKKRRAKNKARKKFHKLKKETRDGLSCENEAKLQSLNRNYENKINICNIANRAAIRNFEQNLSRNVKEDSKSFYNYVRNKQKRKERVGPLKGNDRSEEVIVDDEEAAEVLNKYFSSVFTLEDLGNIPEPKQTCLDSGNGLAQIIFTKDLKVVPFRMLCFCHGN